MSRYMTEWDEEYEEALRRAEREAERNGEDFDEDEWRNQRMYPDEAEDIENDEEDEFSQQELEPDLHRDSEGEDDFPEDEEDDPEESSGKDEQQPEREPREYPEDPWAEDDHNQRARKGGGGHSNNSGLRQAEQNAGDFYDHAYMEPEDGHGISVPQLTAFEKDDEEKVFKLPESEEERQERAMEQVRRKYRKNAGLEEEESDAEDQLTDFEDDILEKAEERMLEYFADGEAEEKNIQRLRDDVSYTGSADRQYYQLHRELKHKLDMYEDRIADDPHDNTYYLPHVLGAMEAIDNASRLYNKNRERKEELKEMHETGELSDMQYHDQSTALDYQLQRRLTNNEYEAISGGSSMFGDVGQIMDRWNHLVDDTLSGDPETLQDARDFIGQLPQEVADKLIDEAVDDGLLDRSQATHLMTMAARPTPSLNHAPKPKNNSLASKAKKFFGF